MIKVPEDILREFPIQLGVDRDCEVPILLEFLHKIAPIESLLDIGAHTSCVPEKYGQEIRKLVRRYDGIDVLPPTETESILNHYMVGNALDIYLPASGIPNYEVVICVSSIEHSGVSTYKVADIQAEQTKLFKKCLELAEKYVWISFPVGQEYVYPNELSIITEKQLKEWETLVSDFKVKERFFYNQGPQARHPWYEYSKREVAVRIPYIDYIGNQSIAVLEIDKT